MPLFRRDRDSGALLRAPEAQGGEAVATWIGRATVLEGRIRSSEDICIQGRLEGVVEGGGEVLIPEGGRVRAQISARNVVVHGALEGDVHASEQAEIGASGSLVGDISAARVVVKPGARFDGTVRHPARRDGEARASGPAPRSAEGAA